MATPNPNSIRQRALALGLNPSTVSARMRQGDALEQALGLGSRNKIDLEGQKFGRLTVIGVSGKDARGARTWQCRCDCGTVVITPTTARLRNGTCASCGCKQREAVLKVNKRKRSEPGQSSANSLRWSYRCGAKKRGHAWHLTKEQFLQITKQDCFYCGAEPAQSIKPTNCWGPYIYNGIDRVDNSVGYDIENCVACCTSCNKLKGQVSRNIIEKAYLKLQQKE